MKYSDIVNLRAMRPAYNIQEEGHDEWKTFIANDQFNGILHNMIKAVRNNDADNHKSVWIAGTYGTGKSHAGAVLKHLFCDAIDESGLSVAAARFANEREGGAVERDFPEDGLYWGYSLHESGPLPFDRFQFDYGFHRFAFKRSLFCDGANRFPRLRYYEDPLFLARILHQAGSFYALPDQEYLYRCDYRKPSWTTPKVLDYLRGTRENLVFSREKGLARLHWVTAMRLDWEYGKIGIGIRDDLDLQAVSDALALVEAEIDPVLLGQGGPVGHPFRLLMRGALDSLPERSALDAVLAKARYGFVNSRIWYRLRPFVVGRLMGR
jgi:hypothetical protein